MRYYFDPDKADYFKIDHGAGTSYLLHYHIVLTTKYRMPFFQKDRIVDQLLQIILSTCEERNYKLLGLQIRPNHLHVLLALPTDADIATAVKMLKGRSSRLLRKEFPELCEVRALWSRGYFARSLGKMNAAQIKAYLDRQDEHHFASH